MPSTRPEFPQVISRRVACFRVMELTVFVVQDDLWAEFDSRQLHQKEAGQRHDLWPVSRFPVVDLTGVLEG